MPDTRPGEERDSEGVFPPIAVVICTRHRPPSVRDTLRSVLASCPPPRAVIVVDQAEPGSDDPIADLCRGPGVHRIAQAGVGLSRARNAGTAAAESAGAVIVAYTDDDCEADPSWLAGFAAAFASAADVGMVFGTTRAAPYDRSAGLVPAYEVPTASVHRGIAAKTDVEGIGACMAVRVDAWRRMEGFDETLGAGAAIPAADETDLVVRLLLGGFAVAETPDAVVVHHGFRNWAGARPLIGGYMWGIGAAMAKMIRLGGLAALRPLARLGMRWAAGRPVVDLNHLPSRSFRLTSFLGGARAGWTMPLDRRSGRFLPFTPLPAPTGPDGSSPGVRGVTGLGPPVPQAADGRRPARGGIVAALSARQMAWLFNGRMTGWMRDATLRRQLPPAFRAFAAYCRMWAPLTGRRWIPGGKQAFFLAASCNRLFRGPAEVFLRLPDAVMGIDLSDPRMIKAVDEALPGSEVSAVLGPLLAPGDSFVDVGANHGSYAVAASGIVGREGAVVAIEPQPALASLLARSLERTAPCRAEVLAVAVGARRDRMPFYVLRRNSGESSLFTGPSTAGWHSIVEVPVERIDDVVPWRGLPGKVLLKLDVEGAELRALEGAREMIAARAPPILMEVNLDAMAAAGVTREGLLGRLRELGYDRFVEARHPSVPAALDSLDPRTKRDVVIVPAGRPWPPEGARVDRGGR